MKEKDLEVLEQEETLEEETQDKAPRGRNLEENKRKIVKNNLKKIRI